MNMENIPIGITVPGHGPRTARSEVQTLGVERTGPVIEDLNAIGRSLVEAEACTHPGERGALVRREGPYSSHLNEWRGERDQGARQSYLQEARVQAPSRTGPAPPQPARPPEAPGSIR